MIENEVPFISELVLVFPDTLLPTFITSCLFPSDDVITVVSTKEIRDTLFSIMQKFQFL